MEYPRHARLVGNREHTNLRAPRCVAVGQKPVIDLVGSDGVQAGGAECVKSILGQEIESPIDGAEPMRCNAALLVLNAAESEDGGRIAGQKLHEPDGTILHDGADLATSHTDNQAAIW